MVYRITSLFNKTNNLQLVFFLNKSCIKLLIKIVSVGHEIKVRIYMTPWTGHREVKIVKGAHLTTENSIAPNARYYR